MNRLRMLYVGFAVVLFILLFSSSSFARGVVFKDGTIVYGKILDMSGDKITILTNKNETITRDYSDVKEITKDPDPVESMPSASGYGLAPENYVVIKGGIYSPQSSDLKDADFDTGFNGEIAIGHYFNKYLAAEFGVGYFRTSSSVSGSIASENITASGSIDADIYAIPVTIALKGVLPVKMFEFYAIGGIGVYFSEFEIDGRARVNNVHYSGSISDSAAAFGGFVGGGMNINFPGNWYIGAEGKYTWVKPSFDFYGVDVDVKLDGWAATLNLGYKF